VFLGALGSKGAGVVGGRGAPYDPSAVPVNLYKNQLALSFYHPIPPHPIPSQSKGQGVEQEETLHKTPGSNHQTTPP
jgi:hypothetical protein